MTNKLRRAATLFMIFAVALAGVGMAFTGGVAAETTTLAGDGSDEVTDFTANESNDIENSIAADGTDFDTDGTETLYMNVTYDGDEYATVEATVSDGTSASQTVNISNDELSDLPGDAGQATTVTVNTWGENSSGDVTTAETSFDTDITFDSSYAATTVDDDSAEIEDREAGFFSLSTFSFGAFGDDEPADLHTYDQTVGVDGDNTTVTVNDATTNGSDAFSDAMEDKSSGDLIYSASAGVDGSPVLAFYQEADTDIVDEETDTYAIYDQNGNGEWTFELGDDYSDAEEVDVYVSSQSYTAGSTFESADLGSLFIDSASMGMMDLGSEFGYLETFSSFSFTDLLPF